MEVQMQKILHRHTKILIFPVRRQWNGNSGRGGWIGTGAKDEDERLPVTLSGTTAQANEVQRGDQTTLMSTPCASAGLPVKAARSGCDGLAERLGRTALPPPNTTRNRAGFDRNRSIRSSCFRNPRSSAGKKFRFVHKFPEAYDS